MLKIYYWPYDWLTTRFTPRDRGAFAIWIGIFFIVSIPLQYPYKDAVWLVWLLSELALILSQFGVVSAETPVQQDIDIENADIDVK